jgi:hypothetical protein
MKTYLSLFEQAVRQHAQRVGRETAFDQARRAGLKISEDGCVLGYTGNPQVVLLRLVRFFTEDGCTASLDVCETLLDEILRKYPEEGQSVLPSAKRDSSRREAALV